MHIAFISDLHLSPDTPDKNELFAKLLQKLIVNKFDSLYILGDFFDYWLGDDDINEFSSFIMEKLKQASQYYQIYFLYGNHDFAVGDKFAKYTGVKLIDDMTTIYTGTDKILLSHGDTFCTLDLGYQKMKKIIRNPIVLFILRRLPLSTRYKIKGMMEKGSHESNAKTPKPIETYNVVDATIAQYAKQYGANIVVHGHTHNPGSYKISTASSHISRFEIPDWEDREAGEYLVYSDNKFSFAKISM
jgi:UDP-2,3-diacylglucosamine hydrolase